MSLETCLTSLVCNGVAQRVVGYIDDRFVPLAASQGEKRPYVTYQIRKDETMTTLADGPSDYRHADIELGIYGDKFIDVAELSDALQTYLDDFGETAHDACGSYVEFAPIMFQEETDIESVIPEGKETPIYLRVQTYRALYRVLS